MLQFFFSYLLWLSPPTPASFSFGTILIEEQDKMQETYKLAMAIATQEGAFKEGSLAQRNHNPGNLKKNPPYDSQGHSIYDTELEGWMDLWGVVQKRQGKPLEEWNYAQDPTWASKVRSIYNKLYVQN